MSILFLLICMTIADTSHHSVIRPIPAHQRPEPWRGRWYHFEHNPTPTLGQTRPVLKRQHDGPLECRLNTGCGNACKWPQTHLIKSNSIQFVICVKTLHLLANLRLDSARNTWITDTEEPAGRRARSEPVTAGQPLDQGLKMDLQVNWRMLLRDFAQGLYGFVSNDSLLHCC